MANFLRDLGKKEILVPHLDSWFSRAVFPDEIKFAIKPNKEKDTAFHPSGALGCAREMYAIRENHVDTRDYTGSTYKTFMFGHYFHAMIQHIVVEELGFASWDDVERELSMSAITDAGNGYWVKGFADIAHCVVPNQGTYLVDIKTVNARMYATGFPPSMFDKYNAQVNLYLDWLDMDEAILLCAEKDSPHRFKEIMIRRDIKLLEGIYDNWELVVDAQAAGWPPNCTCQDAALCPVRNLYDPTQKARSLKKARST